MKRLMALTGCAVGMVVMGERVTLLRDSFEKFNGESIDIVGEAELPNTLLPSPDEHWKGQQHGLEFESRVQRWLEQLKATASTKGFSNDLKKLFNEPIIRLLQLGEVRSGPRWSKALQ